METFDLVADVPTRDRGTVNPAAGALVSAGPAGCTDHVLVPAHHRVTAPCTCKKAKHPDEVHGVKECASRICSGHCRAGVAQGNGDRRKRVGQMADER